MNYCSAEFWQSLLSGNNVSYVPLLLVSNLVSVIQVVGGGVIVVVSAGGCCHCAWGGDGDGQRWWCWCHCRWWSCNPCKHVGECQIKQKIKTHLIDSTMKVHQKSKPKWTKQVLLPPDLSLYPQSKVVIVVSRQGRHVLQSWGKHACHATRWKWSAVWWIGPRLSRTWSQMHPGVQVVNIGCPPGFQSKWHHPPPEGQQKGSDHPAHTQLLVRPRPKEVSPAPPPPPGPSKANSGDAQLASHKSRVSKFSCWTGKRPATEPDHWQLQLNSVASPRDLFSCWLLVA